MAKFGHTVFELRQQTNNVQTDAQTDRLITIYFATLTGNIKNNHKHTTTMFSTLLLTVTPKLPTLISFQSNKKNRKLFSIEDLGRTGCIRVDLDLQSQESYGHDPYTRKRSKVTRFEKQWKRMDRRRRLHYLLC